MCLRAGGAAYTDTIAALISHVSHSRFIGREMQFAIDFKCFREFQHFYNNNNNNNNNIIILLIIIIVITAEKA